jgi:hypothetical protein
MNMSTKYSNKNVKSSIISDTGKIVVHNVPKCIKRTLRHCSEKSADSMRDGGSESAETYKAILYYLVYCKKINVDQVLKSNT